MTDNNKDIKDVVHMNQNYSVVLNTCFVSPREVEEQDTSNHEYNWLVVHNQYSTVEFNSHNLVDALTLAEALNAKLINKDYLRYGVSASEEDNLIRKIKEETGAQVVQFPSSSNDEDPNNAS